MAAIIKNQVLKHLTKFFKDLAPEQLQLSAFKGSCELSNLQLEEKVLMDMLSFPAWVRINKAECDQLSIKIPWTKIKSVPIQMNLNEVTVEVEVCEEFRDIDTRSEDDISSLTSLVSNQVPGKYGFVDRVIDGITVTVNNILIVFKSKLMSATFNLSRVLLESRCPNWKQGELSLTKIKDPKREQILLFKVIDWQTMRLEAKCLTDPQQAPLRLITNHAQCRLTIKKNLNDCSVVAARIFLIFEDILWVLTFAQFTSAASFVEYVFSLIKRSPVSKKTGLLQDNQSGMGGNFTSSCPTPTPNTSSLSFNTSMSSTSSSTMPPLISSRNTTPIHSSSTMKQPDTKAPILTGNLSSASLIEQKFLCYDLVETSLHLYIDKVDAHLYDDIETNPQSGKSRETGGALQTTLDSIQVDCYPYSRVVSDRKHWYKWFDPSPSSRKQWIRDHFAEFDLLKSRNANNERQECGATTDRGSLDGSDKIKLNLNAMNSKTTPTEADEQLLSLTVLVKVREYCMNCVATNHSARGVNLNKFIETDKDYQMPSEMPALYLELNYFYYFDAINRMMVYDNVPEPLAFMHLSPTKLLFDTATLVFLNSFHMNLSKAFVHLNDLFPQEAPTSTIECRIEILIPQIILPAKKSQGEQQNDVASTSSLLVKSGKITLCSSIHDRDVLSKLTLSIDKLKESPCQPINIGGGYQGASAGRRDNSCSDDWTRVWNSSLISSLSGAESDRKKLWAIQFEPVWMDFMNYDVDQLSSGQRLEPIVEPVNAYAFIHLDLSSILSNLSSGESPAPTVTNKRDAISILFSVPDGSILANMDKVQFGFLQRLGMHVEKLIQQIKEDASTVIQLDTVVEDTLEVNLTAYVKEIKARLILDKKIESATTSIQTMPVGVQETTSANKFVQSDATKSKGLSGNSDRAGYFSNLSGIANPFEKQKYDEFSDRQVNEYQVSTVLDSRLIDDNADLDECVEVAGDACLMFGDLDQKTINPPAAFDDPLADTLSIQKTADTSTTTTTANTHSVLGDGSIGGTSISTRSVGKSPIEESLLINLDEIEQSSQLFAKMDLKPQRTLEQDPQQNLLQQSEDRGNMSQQQDIETESISYLELSMSKLMVRRITETKRRQKF